MSLEPGTEAGTEKYHIIVCRIDEDKVKWSWSFSLKLQPAHGLHFAMKERKP